AALVAELTRVGAGAEQTDDGLLITPRPLRPARWRTYADHRMATAGALVGLVVPGLEVEDVATTAKTLPGFVEMWQAMAGGERGSSRRDERPSAAMPGQNRHRPGPDPS
ncbi:MAG: hypothetical protein LBU50_02965, partial [Cellulomonas sp.]|nr:hypothetical protein [Cellulomonas sp.]